MIIVLLSIVPSVIHLITISYIGINVDFGVLFCGYLSLILTAGVYCAIGLFSGSVTTNPIVSFMLSFLFIILFFLMDYIMLYMPLKLTPFLQYISMTWQTNNLIKGVIDSRVMVYFFSLIYIFLWSATNVLKSKTKR